MLHFSHFIFLEWKLLVISKTSEKNVSSLMATQTFFVWLKIPNLVEGD